LTLEPKNTESIGRINSVSQDFNGDGGCHYTREIGERSLWFLAWGNNFVCRTEANEASVATLENTGVVMFTIVYPENLANVAC
jgi:hypothetical protein